MRINYFQSVKLNNIPYVEVTFDEKLNFITGINGSGKTSVLSAIMNVLRFDIQALFRLEFSEIVIGLNIKGKAYEIKCVKDSESEETLTFSCEHLKKTFEISSVEELTFEFEEEESEENYYSQIVAKERKNPVVQFFLTIPTPTFLGLDRRHRNQNDYSPHARFSRGRTTIRRYRQLVFHEKPLADSLEQALSLAEEKFHDIQGKASSLSSEFVKDLVLALLDLPSNAELVSFDAPAKADRLLIEDARRAILNFPKVPGISADDVRDRIAPKLDEIGKLLDQIPENFEFEPAKDSPESKDPHHLIAVLKFNTYKPALHQLNSISKLISIFHETDREIKSELKKYTNLLDEFFKETNKISGFSSRGNLVLRSGEQSINIHDLSSGEAQIFVLLTHLSFNPDLKEAGVFIIDEPELSLHILWQEILVSNVIKANSDLQYIMATHSPTIIGDNISFATDLTKFSVQQ